MKRIKCEMCGGTDFIKENGVFVCQNCGTKYTADEARKNMVEIEGTVNVQGTVKIDNKEQVKNYLDIAQSAIDSGNLEEAENYANKTIEIDSKNPDAWFIKGVAAAWQSTTVNCRIEEAVNYWEKALNICQNDKEYFQSEDEEKKKKYELEITIGTQFSKAVNSMCDLYSKQFKESRSKDQVDRYLRFIDSLPYLRKTLKRSGAMIKNDHDFYNYLSRELNNTAYNAFNNSSESFGTTRQEQSDWAWNRFVIEGNNCLYIFSKAISISTEEKNVEVIYGNLQHINTEIERSHSYTPGDYGTYLRSKSLNSTELANRSAWMAEQKNKYDKQVEEIRRSKKRTIENHWKRNAKEKEELDQKISDINNRISDLNDELSTLPNSEAKADAERNLIELIQKKNEISIFKHQERAEAKANVEKATKKVHEIEDEIKKHSDEIRNSISQLNKEKDEIQDKLDNPDLTKDYTLDFICES